MVATIFHSKTGHKENSEQKTCEVIPMIVYADFIRMILIFMAIACNLLDSGGAKKNIQGTIIEKKF